MKYPAYCVMAVFDLVGIKLCIVAPNSYVKQSVTHHFLGVYRLSLTDPQKTISVGT